MINCRDLLLGRTGVAWLVLAALAIELASTPASAQQSEGLCFDIILPRQKLRPEGAFLLNRCTGQAWLLTRIDSAARQPAAVGYRWSLLEADDVEAQRPSPPAEAPVPVPVHPSAEKCFNFQGRQFCE
jgi:hypothetical protein